MHTLLTPLCAGALALTLLTAGCTAPAKAPAQLTAQTVSVTPAASAAVDRAAADLGLSLLRQVRTEDTGSVLLSPLSAELALSLAANGAAGETLRQFDALLDSGTDLDTLNAACAQWLRDYRDLGGSTQATLANSLWVDPEGAVRDDYIGRCSGVFDAQVFQTDLSAPAAVDQVNRWVSDQTKGLIPQLVQQPFQENAAAVLVNALYLKNAWRTPFNANNTYSAPFTPAQGKPREQDYLCHGSLDLTYLSSADAEGVLLPYDDGRLAFFALLPRENLDALLDGLTGDQLTQLLTDGREYTLFLHLGLPKFETEWSGSLVEPLTALGLAAAFDPLQADFSNLGDDPNGYYLSQVIQAAKLSVNEKGTQAAAATLVEADTGCGLPRQDGITLDFDRPFLYGIADVQTGLPLFLGTFEE